MTLEEAYVIAHDYGASKISVDFDGSYYDVKSVVIVPFAENCVIGTGSSANLSEALDEMIESIREDVA